MGIHRTGETQSSGRTNHGQVKRQKKKKKKKDEEEKGGSTGHRSRADGNGKLEQETIN